MKKHVVLIFIFVLVRLNVLFYIFSTGRILRNMLLNLKKYFLAHLKTSRCGMCTCVEEVSLYLIHPAWTHLKALIIVAKHL